MMTESEMKQLLQQDGKKVEAALQELLPDDGENNRDSSGKMQE